MAGKRKKTVNTSTAAMSSGHGLGSIRTVKSFRQVIESQSTLTLPQRRRLLDQAEILIRDLYTHLPLKRAMHAIDPLQSLKLLRQKSDALSITAFHVELLTVFKSLRDLHTNYMLPAPFGRQMAFLGILVEEFFEAGVRKWMVSKVAEHLVTDSTLVSGAEITHWNGMPIELAVWRNSDKEAGGNESARLARGLEALTLRYMRSSLPPDEDWVTITYEINGATHEARLDWLIFDSGADLTAGSANPSGLIKDLTVPLRYNIGLDERAESFRQARKAIFNRSAVAESKRVARYKGAVPRSTRALSQANILPTSRPDEITAKIVTTASGSYGYLRLWTFHMSDADIGAFVDEVIRLLEKEMPPEGLILDVRGNGGGYIIAAEFLLQLLTPVHITPEPTQFVATPGTLSLARADSVYAKWRASLAQSVSTGAQYSTGIELSPEDMVNSYGQCYFGPVVLVTDAYCYSACDMFAAGFQDHEIGTIIGADERTGAGGANVLTHEDLRKKWADGPLKPLPAGAGMRVSLRRTLRVGTRMGQPVEDLGVLADRIHQMTKADVLSGNVDLLNQAGQLLANGTPRSFNVKVKRLNRSLSVEINSMGISSVDVFADGRPIRESMEIVGGNTSIQISLSGQITDIVIDGYDNGEYVASRKIPAA